MQKPATLSEVLNACLNSVITGSVELPTTAHSYSIRSDPRQFATVTTTLGKVWLVFDGVTDFQLYGGDVFSENGPITLVWRDAKSEVEAWIEALAAGPSVIDLRNDSAHEALYYVLPDTLTRLLITYCSFRWEDEIKSNAERFTQDGILLVQIRIEQTPGGAGIESVTY